jgi:hypothetical protein
VYPHDDDGGGASIWEPPFSTGSLSTRIISDVPDADLLL